MQKYTLTEDQREAVDAMLSPKSEGACLLASDPGTGKTLVGVTYAMEAGAETVLIVAPLQTIDGWENHFRDQGCELPFRQISSDKDGKNALDDWMWLIPGVYFVGQEYFERLGWMKQPLFNRDKTPRLDKKTGKQLTRKVKTGVWDPIPDVIIFDEVHRAQSHDSWTFKTLMNADAKYKIGASGTPTGNSFDGAYAVTKWLWPHRAEKNIYDWRHVWAETKYDPFAVRNEKTVGERNPGAFFNQLPCYVRIEADVVTSEGVKVELERHECIVKLPAAQRKVYDDLDSKMVAWIKDNPLVVEIPVVKRTRQRQVTLGMPSISEDLINDKTLVTFDLECESVKIDKLMSIVDTEIQDETALLFTDSRIFSEVLVHRLNKRYGEGSARKWTGGMTMKRKRELKADFMAGKFQFLVCVISAVGTGTDGLQEVCRNMVYLSSSDSRIDNEQSIARAMRNGQQSEVVRVWWILAENTIDTGQISKQMADAIAMNKILKKQRRRRAA